MTEPIHDPPSGLERPLPPRRALRPPRGYVVGVAAGAVALFSLSLVRTADLELSDFTGGEAEAAEAADVPAAEPVSRSPRAPLAETDQAEPSDDEDDAAEARPEVQTASLSRDTEADVEAAGPAPRPDPTPAPLAPEPEPEVREPRRPVVVPPVEPPARVQPPPIRVEPEPVRPPEPQGLGEVIPDAAG